MMMMMMIMAVMREVYEFSTGYITRFGIHA
jgi:hypothetical protein